jgi:hypothetical protein
LTCISLWYICIPNIIWIHITITEKMNGSYHYHECDGRLDGRTDGEPDGHRIIRPVFNGRILNLSKSLRPGVGLGHNKGNLFCILQNYGKTYSKIFLRTIPVRIRVRIDPPHPLVCRKRRLNGEVLRMRPEKPKPRVTAGVAQ